jgi:hypothetical protein
MIPKEGSDSPPRRAQTRRLSENCHFERWREIWRLYRTDMTDFSLRYAPFEVTRWAFSDSPLVSTRRANSSAERKMPEQEMPRETPMPNRGGPAFLIQASPPPRHAGNAWKMPQGSIYSSSRIES